MFTRVSKFLRFWTLWAWYYDLFCLRFYWIFPSLNVRSSPKCPEPQKHRKPYRYVWFPLFSMNLLRSYCIYIYIYIWLSLPFNGNIKTILQTCMLFIFLHIRQWKPYICTLFSKYVDWKAMSTTHIYTVFPTFFAWKDNKHHT